MTEAPFAGEVILTVGGTSLRTTREICAVEETCPAPSCACAVRVTVLLIAAVAGTGTWKIRLTVRAGGATGRISLNVAAPVACRLTEATTPLSSAATTTLI